MLTQIRPTTQPQRTALPRPFLKWAGGKSQLLQQYQPFIPQKIRHYYEPFLGGGALFFSLQPQVSFLMDVNLELINLYRSVQSNVTELIAHLSHHQEQHSEAYYYDMRSRIQDPTVWFNHGNNVERAARLVYLNKTCFNGLYRENSKGHFNVPLGRYKNPCICDRELLEAASAVLANTQIEAQSFEVILEHDTSRKDFVYFDPPYHPISQTSKFTSYNRDSFTPDDQVRLRDTFVSLSDRGVKVMLSNSDCAFIRDLYQGFNIYEVSASRHINSKGGKRGKITELMITSY
jgi:DNA adenine methylase